MKSSSYRSFAWALVIGLGTAAAQVPEQVKFFGPSESSIAAGVAIPAATALYWSSGTPPPEAQGDTYTQAVSALESLKTQLEAAGLGLEQVIYLRVYLVAPASAEPDFSGWFKAYGEFFNNQENPAKPARSTLAVAGLVDPGWLIEIEAFAAYPEQ